jgi:hypothetical protein
MASTKNPPFETLKRLQNRLRVLKETMQRLILLVVAILSLNSVGVSARQVNSQRPTQTADHAVIQRRRIVLVRSATLAKQFPHKRRAIVTYPVISGLSPVVLRRVRSVLDFKNIFDYSLKEYREDAWLTEFSYVVNYNDNSLLDITFSQRGSGAYPDDQTKHFLINLRNGSVVKASDVFQPDKMNELVAWIDRELQREIKQIDKENRSDEDAEAVRQAYEQLRFELKDLDDFSVGPKGITFLYDAGFPHVIKALEPKGRYLLSYSALRSIIKRDGPLGQFVD